MQETDSSPIGGDAYADTIDINFFGYFSIADRDDEGEDSFFFKNANPKERISETHIESDTFQPAPIPSNLTNAYAYDPVDFKLTSKVDEIDEKSPSPRIIIEPANDR